MTTVAALSGREILDSRGRPTVAARCVLASGATGDVSVPSGASRGSAEAHELRDGRPERYRGLGCTQAARNVGLIGERLRGRAFADQAAFDQALLALDGSSDKSALGANALLAASLAFARALAAEDGLPLYRSFARQAGLAEPTRLPRMTINLFSGGKHAGGQIALQDVLVVPLAPSIDGGLACVAAVYDAAKELVARRYGARPLVADEGGLAPDFASVDDMLGRAVDAIEAAGLRPGVDVALAVDVASSHFFVGGRYAIERDAAVDAPAMIERLVRWANAYPIASIEDGLAEDDWEHWPQLRERLAPLGVLTLGDDFLCTNPARIARAVRVGAADALLLKVNQIGTLSEAADALRTARAARWLVTVSARSGETEDDWLADLAVGFGGDQIKVGSIVRSERLAKYNRLLDIERETGWPVADWPRVRAKWLASC